MNRDVTSTRGVRRTVAELRSIRSDDPAASFAIAAVRATIHTLEGTWCDARPTTEAPIADQAAGDRA